MPPIPDKKPASVPAPALAPAPQVRLAAGCNELTQKDGGFIGRALQSPVVRLATAIDECGPNGSLSNAAFERHLAAPSIKLAHVPGAQGDNVLIGQRGVAALPDTSLPALLVSYYYLEAWELNKHKYHYRDWVMDSGAFSAHNSGAVIVLQDYIDCCHRLMQTDPTLTEIYSLDVIGDAEAGLANTEEMHRQGVPAIPCFHYGEPWPLLKKLCAEYPKIAIGGCVGRRDKDDFAGQCFARAWPHKFHGFGFGGEKSIMSFPWHSVDATNWEMQPCAYGTWRAFGGQRISVRGSQQNLRAEVEWYLELERRARERWKKEMKLLEDLAPTVRLALAGLGSNTYYKDGGMIDNVLAKPPEVRLGWAGHEATHQEGGAVYKGLTSPSVRLAVQPKSRAKDPSSGLLKPGEDRTT